MIHRFLLFMFLFSQVISPVASAQPAERDYDHPGENWAWGFDADEGGGGSSYLGDDIADVSPERLHEVNFTAEHGSEVTMVAHAPPPANPAHRARDMTA